MTPRKESNYGERRNLWHVPAGPYRVVPPSIGGLVLGYIWHRTGGNTTALALTHGVFNSITFILAYFVFV